MTSPHNPSSPSSVSPFIRAPQSSVAHSAQELFVAPPAKAPMPVRQVKVAAPVVKKGLMDQVVAAANRWADEVEKDPNGVASAILLSPFSLLQSCKGRDDIGPKDAREVGIAPGYPLGQLAVHYGAPTPQAVSMLGAFQFRIIEAGHIKPGELPTAQGQQNYAYASLGGLNVDNGDPDMIALNLKLSAIQPDKDGHSGFLTDKDGKVVTRMNDASRKIKMYDLRNKEAYAAVKEFVLKKHRDHGGVFFDELDYVAAHENLDPSRHLGAADAMGDLMLDVSRATQPGTLIANGGVQDRVEGRRSINNIIAATHAFSCKENLMGRFVYNSNGSRQYQAWAQSDHEWLDARMIDQIKAAKAAGKKHFTLFVIESSEQGHHKENADRVKAKIAEYEKAVPGIEIGYRFFGSDMSFTNERDLQENADLFKLNGKRQGIDENAAKSGARQVAPAAHDHTAFNNAMVTQRGGHSGAEAGRSDATNADALFNYIKTQVKDEQQQKAVLREAVTLATRYSVGKEGKAVGADGDKLSQGELEATLQALNSKFKDSGVSLNASGYNAVASKLGTKERLR